MMQREMPTINESAHSHAIYDGRQIASAMGFGVRDALARQMQQTNLYEHALATHAPAPSPNPPGAKAMANPPRRLVQVFIADTHPAVPLADSLLYSGGQMLTDLTDQELFFDVDLRAILETHNAKRVNMIDKTVKERTEFLEPARIRDLHMTVTTIASF